LPITILVLAVAYLVYDLVKPMLTSPCESIFQQTVVSLKSDLEVVKSKGADFIGREKIQDLAERAQEVALNLKTCCIMSHSGKLSAEEFLKCKDDVERYQRQMKNFAQQVDAAQQLQAVQQTATADTKGQKSSGEKEGAGAKAAGKGGRINPQ
jgi:hypothetical protein